MRTIDLYGDCQAGTLVGPGGFAVNTPPIFFAGDKGLLLRWHLRRYNAEDKSVFEMYPVGVGSTLHLVAKKTLNFEGDPVVISAGDQFNVSGDWPEADLARGEVACRLDLNKAELLALLTDKIPSVSVIFDLEEIDTDGGITTLVQFVAQVNNQVARGNEGDPTPASPEYYTAAQADALFALQAPSNANFRILNGKTRQVLCPETGLYHTLLVKTVGGAKVLAVDQEGMP